MPTDTERPPVAPELTLTEFLLARIAEVDDCEGTGEYGACHDLSTWAERSVRAARQIIDLHSDEVDHGRDDIRHLGVCLTCERHGLDETPWPCATLRVLAMPYADHPDYRAEWR